MPRTIADLLPSLEAVAPLQLAASWDNVGLLVGSRDWPVRSALLTIDLTRDVMDEAIALKANFVVAYHPPIFAPLKRLTDDDPKLAILLRAAGERIAIYSPHTALDAAHGGVNDWLIKAFGKGQIRALKPSSELQTGEAFKIVTFCPENVVDTIRASLAAAGAGRIGAYSMCSFELRGTGTFIGDASTDPVVGKRERLERVDEVRLEMVCPGGDAIARIVAALRKSHPYEEPAYEIYPLHPRLLSSIGPGRMIELAKPTLLQSIITQIKKHLRVKSLEVATADGAPRRFTRAAACAGAGGSMLEEAIGSGCDLFLTGEMRHHDVIEAQSRGCTVILAGHTNTERGYLPTLKRMLAAKWAGMAVVIARRDRHPLRSM